MGGAETVVNDQAFYDLRWNTKNNTAETQRENNRISTTIHAIPSDCRSILDIGTGDGLLANKLITLGKSVTAVDISEVALSKVNGPTLLRSADDLAGVSDCSYDLLLCTEMLEHLDDSTYFGALREFNRVARRAILITVPNKEIMREHTGLCGKCGCQFHIWGHRRRFAGDDLKTLFPSFEALWVTDFGDPLPRYSWPLLWTRTAIAGAWFVDERSPCPECHAFEPAKAKYPSLARICDLVNSNLPRIRREPWLMALYRCRAECGLTLQAPVGEQRVGHRPSH
jgi:SAM-dependent methyltransferase